MKGRTRYPIFFVLTLLLIAFAGFDSSALAKHRHRCCGFGGYGGYGVGVGYSSYNNGCCPAPQPVCCPAPQPVCCPAPQPVCCPAPQPVCCPAPQPVCCPAPRPVVYRTITTCCPVTCQKEETVTPAPEKM